MGRQWSAPKGGLWLTAAMPLRGGNPGWAGMLVSLAVCQALDETGLRAGVKWPNDVVIGRKKLAGILVEVVAGRELAAVGIGLNVRNRLPELGRRVKGVGCRVGVRYPTPDTLHPTPSPWPPTSVARETGQDVDPVSLLSPILAHMNDLWEQWAAGRLAEIREAWLARDACRGHRVRLLPNGPEGVADGIDATGALRVRLDGGGVQLAITGELTFLDQGLPGGSGQLQE
jgi:BirA family biotin operon repressor/biotin-[acetyl-CoA-carboxylase] ligase